MRLDAMTFRDPFPILYSDDIERLASFYERAFGMKRVYRWPGEGAVEYVFLACAPTGIGIAARSTMEPIHERRLERVGAPQMEICLTVEDAATAAARLAELGVKRLSAAKLMPWGEKLAYFEDPDGNVLHITSKA